MTANEIAQMLARDAEGVCRLLLPNGKKAGSEWKAGSVHGDAGDSLSVRLTGNKAGVWKDFAEPGCGGDLIDLFAATNGIPLKDAIKAAKDYLGVNDTQFHGYHKKTYQKPAKPPCTAPMTKVKDYLTQTRKLSPEALLAYKVAEQDEFIVFPYLRDGELIRWKLRHISNKKNTRTSSNSEPCLFGWQAIPDNAREVLICEGEIDALSWWQLGHPALSVPNGAVGHNWIETEFDHLEPFDTLWIAMDNDEPGQQAVTELVDRLGRERCRVINIPKQIGKDANDLLRCGFDALKIQTLFDDAQTLDPEALKPASYYANKVLAIISGDGLSDTGFFTPWDKCRDLRFRPGEVIVIAGVNGHGKSEGVGHLTLDILGQEGKACVASLEFRPEKWLSRLTRQAAGLEHPADGYFWAIQRWYDDKLWVFDAVGTAKPETILEVFGYARKRYGVQVFVIDNLAKCGYDEDDYNGQKAFVDKLTDFAKSHDVIVFLVAHMRKGMDDNKPNGKMAVKGTGAITDMVDTVLVWWRNRKKEQKLNSPITEEEKQELLDKPDALVICEKQRNSDEEPKIALWFHKGSHQFIAQQNAKPKMYVQYSRGSDGQQN